MVVKGGPHHAASSPNGGQHTLGPRGRTPSLILAPAISDEPEKR